MVQKPDGLVLVVLLEGNWAVWSADEQQASGVGYAAHLRSCWIRARSCHRSALIARPPPAYSCSCRPLCGCSGRRLRGAPTAQPRRCASPARASLRLWLAWRAGIDWVLVRGDGRTGMRSRGSWGRNWRFVGFVWCCLLSAWEGNELRDDCSRSAPNQASGKCWTARLEGAWARAALTCWIQKVT